MLRLQGQSGGEGEGRVCVGGGRQAWVWGRCRWCGEWGRWVGCVWCSRHEGGAAAKVGRHGEGRGNTMGCWGKVCVAGVWPCYVQEV